jgi:protein arginine kinase activator
LKKRKCDKCDKQATFHCVEIVKGHKAEKHLCEAHAMEEGLIAAPGAAAGAGKTEHAPINELLSNFIKTHSAPARVDNPTCSGCGLTFAKFKETSLLGCPACYEAFAEQLQPLLEREHEYGSAHVGKVPRRASGQDADAKNTRLLRLRKSLADAVANEDFRSAARLRDELKKIEGQVQ